MHCILCNEGKHGQLFKFVLIVQLPVSVCISTLSGRLLGFLLHDFHITLVKIILSEELLLSI